MIIGVDTLSTLIFHLLFVMAFDFKVIKYINLKILISQESHIKKSLLTGLIIFFRRADFLNFGEMNSKFECDVTVKQPTVFVKLDSGSFSYPF